MKILSGFHNRVARRIARKGPHRVPRTGAWEYPPLEEALAIAGLHPLEHYVAVRQARFVDKIAARPILQLCNAAVRHPGTTSRLRWWTQPDRTDAIVDEAAGLNEAEDMGGDEEGDGD